MKRSVAASSFALALRVALLGQSRQLRRTLFLVFTVAITVGAWWALSAMASPFVTLDHSSMSQDITVDSRTGRIHHSLPRRYADKIAALPNARGVFYRDLGVSDCGGTGFGVTINAYGGPGTPALLKQFGYSKAQVRAFQQDPLGVLTDSKTASRCGWHAGMGIAPESMSGKPMPFHIISIIPATGKGGTLIAHYAYLNRVGGISGRDKVTGIYVHASDPRQNDALAARIQAMFAHADPPVEANPNTVTQNALARFGKVQYLLAFVMIAIFACCILVLTSILAHATTQRRPQMALLQVLGFSRAVYEIALVLEVIVILIAGAATGYGLGQLAIYWLQRTLGQTFQSIAAPAYTTTWLWPGLCLLMIVSLIVPSIIVARLRPTDCRDL